LKEEKMKENGTTDGNRQVCRRGGKTGAPLDYALTKQRLDGITLRSRKAMEAIIQSEGR